MFTLLNYLRNYENKISEGEIPEKPFLDQTNYNLDNFNLNSFTKTVMEKITDSNFLVKELKGIIENIKEEIVAQINNNFNNYVSLISKLQALDFLIENIQKPLDNINTRILCEISHIEKYENELVTIYEYIRENNKQVNFIKQSLTFLKNADRCKKLISQIHEKYEKDNLIAGVINRHPDDNYLNSYDLVRKFLFDIIRFVEKTNLLKNIVLVDNSYNKIIQEIKNEEEKYFNHIEDLLRITLNDIGERRDDNPLVNNLMTLIIKCYIECNREDFLNTKIIELSVAKNILAVFDSQKSISGKLDEFNSFVSTKFGKYLACLSKASANKNCLTNFNITCLILPVIERLSNDKYIFNCVDYNNFKDNLNSILTFITKHINLDNYLSINPLQLAKIKAFIGNFSFFTYFQFLQNDICKVFSDEGINSYENLTNDDENLETFISKKLMAISNLNFNFIRILEDFFRDKRLFLKIVPNFLTFLLQINKFFISKQVEIIQSNNMNKIIDLIGQEGFSFEEANMIELKRNLIDYITNIDAYLFFFSDTLPAKLKSLISRDIFIFRDEEDFARLNSHIDVVVDILVRTIKTLTDTNEIMTVVSIMKGKHGHLNLRLL
jgi:hypothetical protein